MPKINTLDELGLSISDIKRASLYINDLNHFLTRPNDYILLMNIMSPVNISILKKNYKFLAFQNNYYFLDINNNYYVSGFYNEVNGQRCLIYSNDGKDIVEHNYTKKLSVKHEYVQTLYIETDLKKLESKLDDAAFLFIEPMRLPMLGQYYIEKNEVYTGDLQIFVTEWYKISKSCLDKFGIKNDMIFDFLKKYDENNTEHIRENACWNWFIEKFGYNNKLSRQISS